MPGTALIGSSKGNIEINWIRLCGVCIYDGDDQWLQGDLGFQESLCDRCGLRSGGTIYDAKANDPRLAGWGPAEATACVTVDLYQRYVWDVNRYYATLGVDPKATKKELREAYQAKRGWENARLTYILKQLLDDEVRAHYDALPLGKLLIDDLIVSLIRVAETDHIAQRLIDGDITFEEAVEMLNPSDDDWLGSSESVVDTDAPAREDRWRWAWGHYVWQSGCKDFLRLAQWQGALSAAIAERKEGLQFAVGFMGHQEASYEVRVVGYRVVAFLSDTEQPTTDAVEMAASRVVQLSGEQEQLHG